MQNLVYLLVILIVASLIVTLIVDTFWDLEWYCNNYGILSYIPFCSHPFGFFLSMIFVGIICIVAIFGIGLLFEKVLK